MESKQNETEAMDHDVLDLDVNDGPTFEMMDFEEEKTVYENLVFVDVQGFKTYRERFICKEFCLISDDDFYHAIIESPYAFKKMPMFYQRQAKWLTKHFHGLTYDCGDVHMIQVIQKAYPKMMGKVVVVKGVEKVIWIKYMFRNCGEIECINFEDLDLDENLKNIYTSMCEYHLNTSFTKINSTQSDSHEKNCQTWPEYHCAEATALKLKVAVDKSKSN